MKIKFLKTIFLLGLVSSTLTSCVGDDDYVIPTVYNYAFNEGFSSSPTGSGSNEVAIALEGWVNYNATATRLWHARTFDSNIYAEFSSFYSATGTNDVAWLITPALDFTASTGEILSIATWTPLTFATPTADDVFTSSGNIDLSTYESDNVRIAFKYTGSKSGVTTTCQLDNIKIVKN